MASDIVITPSRGSTTVNSKIEFTGASTATSQIKLEVLPDGSLAFNGTTGTLFSIADSVTGSLMSVNDASGLPILEVFDTDRVVMGKYGRNNLLVDGTTQRVGINSSGITPSSTPSNPLDIRANWVSSTSSQPTPEQFAIRGDYPSIALRSTLGTPGAWLEHVGGDGNLYFYGAKVSTDSVDWDWAMKLYPKTLGVYAEAQNSFRAPIFYDSLSSAYYCDPGSTSNLNGLTVTATITGNISGTAASETLATVTGRGASTSTNTTFSGTLTVTGGAKIIVQNTQDGGTTRGIFLWSDNNPDWSIYMATAGASKSSAGGTTAASIDGRTSHHVRYRAYAGSAQGHIWENSSEQAIMSLTGDTGNLYTRGQIYAGNSTTNLVLHTGNYTTYAAPASHNHTSLTSVTSIAFATEGSDSASIATTISGTSTFFDFNLTDDNNNDWWRWRFTPSGSTVYDAMTLKPSANGVSDLVVAGTVTGTRLISNVANGTAPLTVTSTTKVTNLNADLLDGLDVHTGTNNEANKIVRTDGNGYIQAGWINTISGDQGTSAIDRVYASYDQYIRYYTPANFRTVLNVPTRTGGDASGTWGISITGNAATATSADQIDGVAFRNTGSNSGTAADSLDSNGITYVSSNVSIFSGITDGALYSQAYNSTWQHQIYGDYRSGQIVVRGKNNGTWQSWRTVLDSSNYTSYTGHIGNGTLTLNTSGGGLSGTASFTANQSGGTTFTVTSNATSSGGAANTLVQRNASGQITATMFADSDNSSYYVDPDQSSYLNFLYLKDGPFIDGSWCPALTAGTWYTIAANAGDRASGEFVITDLSSGYHQEVKFTAAANYGTTGSITVLSNSFYSGPPVQYIRIKQGSTYEGAALQIYVSANISANNLKVMFTRTHTTNNGWVFKQFINDNTNPGTVATWANLTERVRTRLDYNGFLTSYSGFGLGFDTATRLSGGSANSLRITNSSGYVDIGPQNTTYCHYYTDRASGHYFDKTVNTASNFNGGEYYASGWFRTNGANGLYNGDYAMHFYSGEAGYYNVAGGGSLTYGGLKFRAGHASTFKGSVYWDNDGFGLLNSNGNWAVRSNQGSAYAGGTLYGAWTKASSNYTSGITLPGMFVQSGTSTGVPTAIQNGDLWWNTDTGKLNIWWSTSNAWVVATPTPDMSQYYPVGGGNINGNVSVSGLLTATGNITATSGGSYPMTIGVHPSYQSYAGLWRQGSDYTLITDGSTNTFLNTPNAGGAIYFRTGNNTRAYVESNGYFYANRYYDLGDSTYYTDPGSTSNLNGLTVNGSGSYYSNQYFYSNKGSGVYLGATNSPGLQAYSSDGGAAFLSFHRSGSYAVNMGLDPDNVFRIGGWSASSNRFELDMSGNVTITAAIRRRDHAVGFLEGSYNNVGANDSKSNPIYTIGSSYNPTATAISNMYGIGYSHSNFFGTPAGGTGAWGLYVVNAGSYSALITHGGSYFNSSAASPIFYDSASTGYYVDPGSTSNINQLNVTGGAYFTGAWYEFLMDGLTDFMKFRNSSNQTVLVISRANSRANFSAGPGTANGFTFNTNAGNGFLFNNNGDLNVTGVVYTGANTNYYLAASATSIFEAVRTSYTGVNNGGSGSNGNGLSLYGAYAGGQPTYGVMFQQTASYGTFGNVTGDWATYFTMNNTANRGWIFRDVSTPANVAAISNAGLARFKSLGINTDASATAGEIRATDNITAYYSDERLKTKLGPIENPIEKVKALSGFYFEANETAVALGYQKRREIGVSAQEVQAILPEIVTTAPISDEYLTVRYEKMIPLLIEAIKAQQVQIDELKALLASKA